VKTIYIIAISVGMAVVGVLLGLAAYQQAEMSSEYEEIVIELETVYCDASYPTVCIPLYPPDLDCGEISDRNFKVSPPDPHGFDPDEDGIGCES